MNRIASKFEYLKSINKKALIPFITGGDSTLSETYELILRIEEAGADIIEIGIPYSDPLADGPTIQASYSRALKSGTKISKIMDMIKNVRLKTDIPLVYLVYYNAIFKYGMEKFLKEASQAGIDGCIIPDLPVEERLEILKLAKQYDICLIPLVAPTSEDRIASITANGSGFVYCVAVNGVTGARTNIDTCIEDYMNCVSSYTNLPKALGFGISGGELVKKLKPYCEGIIIGSALINKINEGTTLDEKLNNAYNFISEIRSAL